MIMLAESQRWLSTDTAIYFLYVANILYLVCYGVRDVLWLRIFCVIALVTILPYYMWGTESIQNSCILWNLAFLAINLFWIIVIFRERQPPKMTDEQKQLYSDVFQKSCSPQEMLKLLCVSESKSASVGTKLITKATHPDGLILVEQGTANVVVDSVMLAKLGRGDFLGEMNYLTNEPASADVVAATHVQYRLWKKEALNKVFEGRPELKSAVNEIIGHDLIRKLTSGESKIPELSVETVVNELI